MRSSSLNGAPLMRQGRRMRRVASSPDHVAEDKSKSRSSSTASLSGRLRGTPHGPLPDPDHHHLLEGPDRDVAGGHHDAAGDLLPRGGGLRVSVRLRGGSTGTPYVVADRGSPGNRRLGGLCAGDDLSRNGGRGGRARREYGVCLRGRQRAAVHDTAAGRTRRRVSPLGRTRARHGAGERGDVVGAAAGTCTP